MKPYGRETSITISGLTIETDPTVLSIYGSIDLSRDQAGLEALRNLRAILDEAEAVLMADKNLPDHLPPRPDGPERDNPF